MQMSRQDFELIAALIRSAPMNAQPDTPSARGLRILIAEHFADELARTNPRFNRDRFIVAATAGQV